MAPLAQPGKWDPWPQLPIQRDLQPMHALHTAQLQLAVLQKVETPSRKAESVPKYEERTSKFDDTLTSSSANPDKVQHCAQRLHPCTETLLPSVQSVLGTLAHLSLMHT